MHKKCNKFLDGELNEFKKSLKQKLVELGIVNVGNNKTVTNEDEETKKMLKISKELLKFINDFKPKQFAAEDFKKRKREQLRQQQTDCGIYGLPYYDLERPRPDRG